MGCDKLFVPVDGVPLLERTLMACKCVFKETVIVARERRKFAHLDSRVLLDPPDTAGPVAGIIAALLDCSEDAAFITAADLCDLREDILRSLLAQYRGEDYLGLRETDHLQPLCGIYSVSIAEHLISLARHEKPPAMHCLLANLHTRYISVEAGAWRNINRPEDLIGDTRYE